MTCKWERASLHSACFVLWWRSVWPAVVVETSRQTFGCLRFCFVLSDGKRLWSIYRGADCCCIIMCSRYYSLKNTPKLSAFISADHSFVMMLCNERIETPSGAAWVTAAIGVVMHSLAWLIPCHSVHQLLIAVSGGQWKIRAFKVMLEMGQTAWRCRSSEAKHGHYRRFSLTCPAYRDYV